MAGPREALAADYSEYWSCYQQMAGLDSRLDTYDQAEAVPTMNVAAGSGTQAVLVTPVLPGGGRATPGLYLQTSTGSFRLPLVSARMDKRDVDLCPDSQVLYSFGAGTPQRQYYFKTVYRYPDTSDASPATETVALTEAQYTELVENLPADSRKACAVSLNEAVGGNPQAAKAWDSDAQDTVRQKVFGMMKLYNAALEIKKRRALEDPSLPMPPVIAEHMSAPEQASASKLRVALNSCAQLFKDGSKEKSDEYAAIVRANSVRLAQLKTGPSPAGSTSVIATP